MYFEEKAVLAGALYALRVTMTRLEYMLARMMERDAELFSLLNKAYMERMAERAGELRAELVKHRVRLWKLFMAKNILKVAIRLLEDALLVEEPREAALALVLARAAMEYLSGEETRARESLEEAVKRLERVLDKSIVEEAEEMRNEVIGEITKKTEKEVRERLPVVPRPPEALEA